MTMLELEDVHTCYGNIEALKGVSLHVDRGEIVTLIGANGAGKTTILNAICGLLKCTHGTVRLNGEDLAQTPAFQRVARGISQAPEGRKIFGRLTVAENLEMGAFLRQDKAGVRKDLNQVYSLFPRLGERKRQLGGTLSGGEQQMLAIGRALMARPQILLLDEPSMGLAPLLVREIFNIIQTINAEGTAILLVEQNAAMALSIAQRGYVLETGRIVLEGARQELRANPQVKAAYLG